MSIVHAHSSALHVSRSALLCLLMVLASACDGGCPPGEVCGPMPDGGADAGPCAAGCAAPTPWCDAVLGCVACRSDADCDSGVCDGGACVECAADDDCAAGVCVAQACVECRDAGDCAEGVCAENACVECATDTDCASGLSPRCTEANTCASCAERDDCTGELWVRELRASMCACMIETERDAVVSPNPQAEVCHAIGTSFRGWERLAAAIDAGVTTVHLPASCPSLRNLFEAVMGGRGDPRTFGGYGGFDVVRGMRSAGAACVTPFECASGDCREDVSCPGSCTDIVGPGDACGEGVATCSAGSVCVFTSGRFQCVMLAPAGSDCAGPDRCESGLVCGRESGGTTAVCRTVPGEGEPCALGSVCAPGLRCRSMACAAPEPDGGACTATLECAFGSRCDAGTCRRIAAPGDACDAEHVCAWGTACREGVCADLPQLGEPCVESEGCLSGACAGGTCTALPAGAPCSFDGNREFSAALDPCGPEQICEDSTMCAPKLVTGQACSEDYSCLRELECGASMCREPC